MGMHVLVTGHEGYIGSVLVPLLQRAGFRVTGCDSGLFRNCTFTGSLSDVDSISKDVRDLTREDLSPIDAVIHLAGLSNDPLGSFQPWLTAEINYKAAVRLAHLAAEAGVARFLFASSCSVYGNGSNDMLFETSRINPLTPYAHSKYQAEVEIAQLADGHFSPTFLRAGTVYGVSPKIRFDLVLNNLTAWAHACGKVHLKSDGGAWRPLLHVQDLAQAYLSILTGSIADINNQAFNIGDTDQNYQIHELAAVINSLLPGSSIEFAKDAGSDFRNYRVNCDKFSGLSTACPMSWTIEKGVRELVEALHEHPVEIESIENGNFSRIANLQAQIRDKKLKPDLYWNT
jgi:nucleoside-diphosphate-sugar epimerase